MVSFTARGFMPAVFNPLNDDLTINFGAIPAYAKFLADSGIKCVWSTGEHMSLAVSDRKKVVDAWVAASKTTGLHIEVQVGGAPLADVTDLLLAPAALLGFKSFIGTSASLFPRLVLDILNAVERNDVAKARALYEKLSLAIEAHICEGPWIPIMKAGMEIVTGIKVGPPSLPQQPISEEAKQRIQSKLRNLGLCK